MDALTEFARYLKASYQPKTVRTYLEACQAFTKYLGGLEVPKLRQEDLQNFLIYLSGNGLSPSTIRTWVFGVYRLLMFLRQSNRIPFDPTVPRLPSPNESRQYALTESQFLDFFGVCDQFEEPYKTALRLLACSGLRIGELVKLKLNDWRVHKSFIIITTTSEKSRKKQKRDVPVLRICNRAFRDYLIGFRKSFSERYPSNDWMFPSRKKVRDDHIRIDSIQESVRKIRPIIHAPQMTPHTLRHTYSTFLSRSHVPPLVHARIMGHKRLDTTLIYTHPTDDELGMAVSRAIQEE